MKKTITIVLTLLAALLIGCSSVMDIVTPCGIEPDAYVYVADEPNSLLPYTSVFDARHMQTEVDYQHSINQLNFNRGAQDDDMYYAKLKGINKIHIANAEQLQQMILSPDNPIGLGISMLLGGSLGAFLIKRPSDKTKTEYESAGKMNPDEFAKISS